MAKTKTRPKKTATPRPTLQHPPLCTDGLPLAAGPLLEAIRTDYRDLGAWQALADCLEESGAEGRAAVVRASLIYWGLVPPERDGQPAHFAIVEALSDRGKPAPCVPEYRNSLGMRLAYIPGGTFSFQVGRRKKLGEATVEPFYLGVFPVTQGEYQQVRGGNPSTHRADGYPFDILPENTDGFPVERVTHECCLRFCVALDEADSSRPDGWRYRLPTHGEWRFACQANAAQPTLFYSGDRLFSYCGGNFNGAVTDAGPTLARTTEVGSYHPNAFGLFDLYGNVCEFIQGDTRLASQILESPTALDRIVAAVGGSYRNTPSECHATSLFRLEHHYDRSNDIGFRVVLAPAA